MKRILLIAALVIAGCATNPVSIAKTNEQRAYAAYGTFTALEERGAVLISLSTVPVNAKLAIQKADKKAKPIADTVLELARTVTRIRVQVEAGAEPVDKLNIANANLVTWLNQLLPLIDKLKGEMK